MGLPLLPAAPPTPSELPVAPDARTRALRDVLRRDLALRWLLLGTVLVAVLALGWFMLVGAWSERRNESGDKDFATGLLALGAPSFVLAAALLAWRGALQARSRRVRRAWERRATQPATPPPPPPFPPPPFPPPAPSSSPLQELGLAARRVVWCAAGGVTLLLSLVVLLGMAVSGYYEYEPGRYGRDPDRTAGTLISVGIGAMLATSGVVALRRGLRRVSPRHWADGTGPRSPWAGTRHEIPDLLGRVTPGGRIDRIHRRTPTATLALAVAALGTLLTLLLGDVFRLGRPAAFTAIPLALVLVFGLYFYERRAWRAVLALVAAVVAFVLGLMMEREWVLAERGVWTEATVVGQETRTEGRSSVTYCRLKYHDGGAHGDEVAHCQAHRVGDEITVLVDPRGEVAPSLSEPHPVGVRNAAVASAAVVGGLLLWGTARSHRERLRPRGAGGGGAMT